jgi:Mor family transcriptional regulator
MSTSYVTKADARRHDLLADVAEQVAHRLIEQHGCKPEVAIDVGSYLADFLSEHWRGQAVYIPGDDSYRLNDRDWEIFEQMRRGNAHELAKKYGISFVRVYQIYKRCLAIARQRNQPGLFGEDADKVLTELSTD